GRLRAAPLYYGMLMFAQAARGALVPVRVEAAPPGLSVFAVRGADETLRVCLINKDIRGSVRAGLVPRRRFAGASVLRLAGPAIDATVGITLAGASIDDAGRWTSRHDERVEERGDGGLFVDVPAASAALVTLRA